MSSPDALILRFLGRRTSATASAIGAACAMAPGEVRAGLVMLESQRLVSGRQGNADGSMTTKRVSPKSRPLVATSTAT